MSDRRRPRRRATDQGLPPRLFVCPADRRALRHSAGALRCSEGHRFSGSGGILDLWPPTAPVPRLDWFSGPYGYLYDTAVKERWLARLGGRLGWGADVDRMYRMMDEGVKTAPGEVVLDVPAGGAPALRSAPGRLRGTYVGIDLSPVMLRRADAERRGEGLENVILARGDITRLPLRDASVDRALCFNGLHVLADKAAALRELHRVLKPGGSLRGNVVITDRSVLGRVARPWFGRGWLFFHPADPDELELLAAQAGFAEWRQEHEGSMLFFEGRRARG